MSAIPALYPDPTPRRRGDEREHIEIVSTRAQRKARPKLLTALLTVTGLFAILSVQLLLTIATSEGAYEISRLQTQQAELARDEQVLVEGLRVLDAPQHLAAEAQEMGMVVTSSTAQLRLSDLTVLGTPTAASASEALRTADDGSPLIPNLLLEGVPLSGAAGSAAAGDEAAAAGSDPETDAGAPPAGETDDSVASAPMGIPSPSTR
ncbi:hypothetical protein [Marisediminicola sp. LYQ134]|uniref:hypothetical protein n=1 Tax=unclassified Marisediminicola TaxID=2618316 RepID=UPI003983800A